ncbi:MAG: hypothetical protein ACR2GJ_03095 [Gemmatimonadaceae bacterium]
MTTPLRPERPVHGSLDQTPSTVISMETDDYTAVGPPPTDILDDDSAE